MAHPIDNIPIDNVFSSWWEELPIPAFSLSTSAPSTLYQANTVVLAKPQSSPVSMMFAPKHGAVVVIAMPCANPVFAKPVASVQACIALLPNTMSPSLLRSTRLPLSHEHRPHLLFQVWLWP
jgi:hypothetical protein